MFLDYQFLHPQKVEGWQEVADYLLEQHPTLEEERKSKVRMGLPYSDVLVFKCVVEFKFRMGLRPQLASVFMVNHQAMFAKWEGENPVFKNTWAKLFFKIFLPSQIKKIREPHLVLLSTDVLVSAISLVEG